MRRVSQFINELKRRNVFRASAAYLVLAWVAVQIADVVLGAFESPAWTIQLIVVTLAVGFPVALVLAWAYEITTTGIKKTEDVAAGESIAEHTGRKLDFIVIGILLVAVAMFALDRFIWRSFDEDTDIASHNYSIAVLPFQSTSEQVPSIYGQLSNDITRLLQRDNQLRLASIDAIEALPANGSAADLSAQLGVRYLLKGAIRSESIGLSVSLSLFDSDADNEVWTGEFENAQLQQTMNAIADTILVEINAKPLLLRSSTTSPRAYELYLSARQHLAADDLSDLAENLYREAISLDARFPLALAGICRFLVHRFDIRRASSDFEEAERFCHRAWTLDSMSIETQQALGDLYSASGQMEVARESYAAALAINPNNPEAQRALAGTFYDDDPDLAEIQLKRIIQQHPGSPNAYSSLAYFYYSHARYTDAIEPAKWVVRLDPDDESAKYSLAGILMYAGIFSEAKSLLLAMLEDKSAKLGGAENNLAAILFFEGDYAAAAELSRNAVERSPEDSLNYRNLGDAIWHLNGKDAAEPIFRRAIHFAEQQLEINPTDGYVLGDLMVAYASVGDSDRFESTRSTLLELDVANAETHYSIAVSASRLARMEAAKLHAKKAYGLGYPVALLRADPDISASGASFD